MDGPSYSEDGEWVWDGYDWVPANGQVPSDIHPEMAMHDVTHAAGSPTPFQQPDVVQPQQFNQPPGFYPPQNQHFDVTQYANPMPVQQLPQQVVFQQPQQMNQIVKTKVVRKKKSGAGLAFGVIILVLGVLGAGVGVLYYSSMESDSYSGGDFSIASDDADNDGILDQLDDCPSGESGWTSNSINDHDSDGCRDSSWEDSDDDNDGVSDYSDNCPTGNTGWMSNSYTDYDGDGCQDNGEDSDDDNDGVSDYSDDCQTGYTGWYSSSSTDFDGDGCQDNGEDSDDDNDGYSDYNDWYDRGNGAISLRLTRFTAWSNGYYDGDGSNPDVYAYIGVDYSCTSDPDFTYYEYTHNDNAYDLTNWFYAVYDFSESSTTVCISVQIWDNDAASDDKLDYVDGSGTSYYWTLDLDEGEGTFSKSYDNRGENDVSIRLDLEFSRIDY